MTGIASPFVQDQVSNIMIFSRAIVAAGNVINLAENQIIGTANATRPRRLTTRPVGDLSASNIAA